MFFAVKTPTGFVYAFDRRITNPLRERIVVRAEGAAQLVKNAYDFCWAQQK